MVARWGLAGAAYGYLAGNVAASAVEQALRRNAGPLLTGLTLFVFRRRGGEAPAFRVPLYPIVPIAFLLMCGYMLYSSINYVRFAVSFGIPVLAGLLIMAAGIPLYFLTRKK